MWHRVSVIRMQYQGRIIKGIGGFYYVDTADGVFECRARGIFRKEKMTPLVGDMAVISVDAVSNTGAVEEILPRSNVLLRPPVANVTQMAVVVATANPRPNLYLLDKLIASAEYADIRPLICWNTTDLDSAEALAEIYEKAGSAGPTVFSGRKPLQPVMSVPVWSGASIPPDTVSLRRCPLADISLTLRALALLTSLFCSRKMRQRCFGSLRPIPMAAGFGIAAIQWSRAAECLMR